MKLNYNSGIFLSVNPKAGYITSVSIVAGSDQEQVIIEGAFARISKLSCWAWIKELIHKRINQDRDKQKHI